MGVEALAVMGGAQLAGGVMQSRAAGDAAQMQADSNYRAMQGQQRQFDLTRSDLQPYMQAGTGSLNQLMTGINQQPGVPQLPGAYTNTPQLQQFGGQAVNAPQLQQFNFDPNQALNDPAMQFQRQMGQQQVDRAAGANRQLGSGQRLIGAQQFGQGLAAQSLGDQFNRQLTQNQQNNALLGQQFNMAGTSLGQGMNINNMQNQTAMQQYGLNAGANEAQANRLMQQYGLTSGAYNDRLNRLAGIVDVGRGAGTASAAAGANSANNISNLMQNTGQAQAGGVIGQANAMTNMLNQGAMMYGMYGGAGGGWNSGSTSGGYGGTGMTSSWR